MRLADEESTLIHDNRALRYSKEGPYTARPARRFIMICDGDEKSSHDVREHAKADPVYVAKASVGRPSCTYKSLLTTPQQLCQTYMHYQPLLDDANCQ